MTLTDFLLARIAEDEAVARAAAHSEATSAWVVGYDSERVTDPGGVQVVPYAPEPISHHIARHDPARVLARCKSDRQLLDLHGDNGSIPGKYELRCFACDNDYPCDTLKIMALPYAEHPDYHREWRS